MKLRVKINPLGVGILMRIMSFLSNILQEEIMVSNENYWLLAGMAFIICFSNTNGYSSEKPENPSSADLLIKYGQQIETLKSNLVCDIPLAQPEFLEILQNGQKWLASLDKANQSGNWSGFIELWKNLHKDKAPSTLLTTTALELRDKINGIGSENKVPKEILQKLDELAQETVLECEALDRIERNRRSDVVIQVQDRDGKPIPNIPVQLKQIRHAFLFGCNVFGWNEEESERQLLYRKRFAELFNYATLGFYWPAYESRKGVTREDHWRRVAEWCQANGIERKGHPLVWNYADPSWIGDDPEETYPLQIERVRREITHFQGLIDIWDVVNEVTQYDRKTFWKQAPKMTAMWEHIGQMELPKQSFITARKAKPKATLVINDYYLGTREESEKNDSVRGSKHEIYEDVIDSLVDESGKRLFDVIGIQSHMHDGPWETQRILEAVKRFSRYQVPIHFTETTIVSGPGKWEQWKVTTPEGESRQAEEVERFYRTVFSCPETAALTWWDFSDYHAWQGAPAGFLRKDMSPKPAYNRLLSLIKGTWWTDTTTKTGPDGSVHLRGYLGKYEVTATTADGKQYKKTTSLSIQKEPEKIILRCD